MDKNAAKFIGKKTLQSDSPWITLIGATVAAIVAVSVSFFSGAIPKDRWQLYFTAVAGVITFITLVSVIREQRERARRIEKIEDAEQRVLEHPEKAQFAWDLARSRLESYLDRNLGHLRSIFFLTVAVILVGFGIVGWGLFQAMQAPNVISVPIIASASGVIISFIGGSFLLIFRSIMAQSKDYVVVLERINAVGMAVQVISSLPAEDGAALRHKATADLAKQLLHLYITPAAAPTADDEE